MDIQETEERLEAHGCRPTAMRISIYRALCDAGRPLSAQELETELDTAERSTITRSLALFQRQRLVHAIDDGSGSVRYEACLCDADADHDSDSHLHFHCRVCGRTYCLPQPVREIEMPEGFEAESYNFVISGVCPECR